MTEKYIWKEVSRWGGNPDWRFSHIAVSSDGNYCFFVWWDNDTCALFDIESNTIIWTDEEDDVFRECAGLTHAMYSDEWAAWIDKKCKDGHLHLNCEPLDGTYRVIGHTSHHPRLADRRLNLQLDVRIDTGEIVLCSTGDDTEIQRLSYHIRSGDWSYATFSDDGSTITIFDSLWTSFFRRFPAD